ncbi:MAG: MoxR family ATPase [Acidobacteriota bacterium]|nr:MoxR family ATPase [Acidobacteriota bacterium]
MSSFPAAFATLIPPGKLRQIEGAIEVSIRGKNEAVRMALVCLLARGHLLIEDVPGVGKTTLAQSLARAVDGSFHRLQFTSDMLPSDVLGVTVYNAHTEQFEFKPGPIFTNFLLADEINRTTAKTQSALLEAMNEQQVSVEGRSLPLPDPFMVIATQNPADHHGTYALPESQLDRFLMRLRIGYPDLASEREIIRQPDDHHGETTPRVLNLRELTELQDLVRQVSVDDAIVDYMLAIVERTRAHEGLALGVSPRGSQAFYRAVQAHAVVDGRGYALPDDVKALAARVFGHRVVPSTRSPLASRRTNNALTGERIIEEILSQIEVPL